MNQSIFDAVRKSAASMGSCNPTWLRHSTEPQFDLHRSGSVGPQMVLLHGLFGALSNWDAVTPLFNSYCRTINFGFPILKNPRADIEVKALAVYLEYFIRKEGLAPITLCGNSLGGHVALRVALAAPQLVRCLVLSGSSGLYEVSAESVPVRPNEKFVREHMAKVFHDQSYVTDAAVAEIHTILKSKSNVLGIISAARSAKKDNLEHMLKRIQCPTLLLWGEDDQVTTMDVATMFKSLIPNSKLVTVKSCGHAPMIEHPQWFADEVQRFLRDQQVL